MDFSLDPAQEAIRELAGRIFADHCADEQIAAFEGTGAPWHDALWRRLAETGLLGLPVAGAHEGGGLGALEWTLLLEQQGRHVAPVPLWTHQLALTALAEHGDPSLRDVLLPAALAGERLLTIGLEALGSPTGPELRACRRAERCGGGWRVSGRAAAVPFGSQAQWALLPAATDAGLRFCVVPLEDTGIEKVPGLATHGEPVADLELNALELDEERMLAAGAEAWLTPRAVACLSALQLGVAEEALRRTAAYSCERTQFERPIGSFQGVALRAADAYIEVEALRSTLWQLAWRLDEGLDATAAARVSKLWACETGHRVAHTAQHLHGGIGADVTYPIHRFFLWSRALELTLGGAGAQQARLGDWLAEAQQAGFEL